MVNGAMIQPVIPNMADKIYPAGQKQGDTTFQDLMDKTSGQKTEDAEGRPEEDGKQQLPQMMDALAQLFFQQEIVLSDSNLPKVNEAGMTVVMDETAAADETVVTNETAAEPVKETVTRPADTNVTENTGELSEGFAGEVKKATETGTPIESGNVKVDAETSKAMNPGEIEAVGVEKQPVDTDAIKPVEKTADENSGKKTVETGNQEYSEAMAYVKEPVQQTGHKEVLAAKTVPVNPENPQEMMKNISDSMVKNIISGKQEFEIQLEPLNLGKLAIKVTYEAGKTAVSIVCSSAKTLEAMSQNAREIGNILDARLGTQTAIIVDHAEPDYLEQQNQQKQDSRQEQNSQPQRQTKREDAEHVDFLQQLRLGLI